jgi:GTPase SAR1 family protein
MNNDPKNILLLGLPETGKTTFLAAFIHSVETSQNNNLRQYKLSTDTTYLTAIVQNWLKAKKTERTKITASNASNTDIEIFLEQKSSGERFTLIIPDFYGEIFESQFFDRLIDVDYVDLIRGCTGILLFINPDKIKYPTLIEDVSLANEVANLIDAQIIERDDTPEKRGTYVEGKMLLLENAPEDTSTPAPSEVEPFNIEDSPTQLVIVDLLETHVSFIEKLPINISVIISAWDTIQNDMPGLSPLKWLEINLPLLYQFLITNNKRLAFKGFGVSAQGGNVDDKNEVERLTNLDNPIERIIVQEENVPHNDITSPIEWIINNGKI